MNVQQLLDSGKYLPPILRDFHDQKDIFKAMHEIVQEDKSSFIKLPDWITGQCYVIDTFLWFMARRGYTLQRSRIKCPDFKDIHTDVNAANERRNNQLSAMLGGE